MSHMISEISSKIGLNTQKLVFQEALRLIIQLIPPERYILNVSSVWLRKTSWDDPKMNLPF